MVCRSTGLCTHRRPACLFTADNDLPTLDGTVPGDIAPDMLFVCGSHLLSGPRGEIAQAQRISATILVSLLRPIALAP